MTAAVPSRPRAPVSRDRASRVGVLLLLVTVGLLAFGGVVPLPTTAATPAAPASVGPVVSASAVPAPTPTPTAAPASLPGANPSSNVPISSQASVGATVVRFSNISSVVQAENGSIYAGPTLPSSGAASAAPTPPATSVALGWFTGTVANQSTSPGSPTYDISGVTIISGSLASSSPCPTAVCEPASTNSSGEFNVTCEAGQDFVTASANWYAENLTYATCVYGVTVAVGTILLLPDGVIVGVVEGDTVGDPGIPGIQVLGLSRDSGVDASPSVTTNTTGGFRVPVPPAVASELTFTVPGVGAIWQNNFTWVTADSGQTVNIGVVFLEPNAVVKAELYSAVTHDAIETSFNTLASLTVCSTATQACGAQGTTIESGNTVIADGTVGYDYVLAEVTGFLVNETPIGYVPGSTPAHPYCVPNNCRIYLTPLGEFQLSVGVSRGSHSLFDDSTGDFVVSVAGLDGFDAAISRYNPATGTYNTSETTTLLAGCVGVPTTIDVPAYPLRDFITVFPDTVGDCSGSVLFPTWPIPGDLPVWSNWTWANATPAEITDVGSLDLTPGTYIEGNVYVAGTTQAPKGGFTAAVQSRQTTALQTYTYSSTADDNVCPESGATVFCAPAPPGPGTLTITSVGYPTNTTWVSVPWTICCIMNGSAGRSAPLTLAEATDPSVQSINLTVGNTVTGQVDLAGGTEPVPFPGVSVCPAESEAPAVCVQGVGNITGGFSVSGVPSGWTAIETSATGETTNYEYIFVNGATVAPTIPLEPLATLEGVVVSTNGTPVIDATITYCALTSSSAAGVCTELLGSGVTQSDGAYLGLVTGGWLPWATDEVEASAPGYVTDWTFVNATSNATTHVPNLVLQSVGTSPEHRGPKAAPVQGTASTWVTGRFVDNSTGLGVAVPTMSACPVSNPTNCEIFGSGTNSGGFFNVSLPTGVYNLTATAAGYAPLVYPLAALTLPVSDVGSVPMIPVPWIHGNLSLSPWPLIRINESGNAHTAIPLMLPNSVDVCNADLLCLTSGPTGTAGNYLIPTYVGFGLQIQAYPIFPGGDGSAQWGAIAPVLFLNVTENETWLPNSETLAIPLFGSFQGYVYEVGNLTNASGNPSTPGRWATIDAITNGLNNGYALEYANGAGWWTVFLDGQNIPGSTNVTFALPELAYSNTTRVWPVSGPGFNMSINVQPADLLEFGWATTEVLDSASGLPVAGVGVSALYSDPLDGRYGQTAGTTNGGGFVNISAPSGNRVRFSFGGSLDYNTTDVYAPVAPGQATNVTGPNTTQSGTVNVDHWGWISGSWVNYSGPPTYVGTVLDRSNGEPLPLASAQTTSPDPVVGYGAAVFPTNLAGEFLSDAPIGPDDSLTVSHPGYESNTTSKIDVAPGSFTEIPTIDLTGYGVVASRVLALPGDVPVSGAVVAICPGTSSFSSFCVYQVTNATGAYWTTAVPGHDTITVQATGFVGNYTESVVVSPDTWTSAADYLMVADGVVYGTVRGLPTGLPLAGAQLALCSPLGGTPTGPCDVFATAGPNGSFALSIDPGQYILTAADPDFNTTYRPVSIVDGEAVDMGIVFLEEYGVVTGTVEDALTGAPILNATVDGCPAYAYLACDAPVATDLAGEYRLASPPGALTLAVSAPGFEDGYAVTSAVSGETVRAPTIVLEPLSIDQQFAVSGWVFSDTGAGVTGALIAFHLGSSIVTSVPSGSAGQYSTVVGTGTYLVTASAPGFVAESRIVTVTAPVSGVDLTLPVFSWTTTVAVEDGLLGTPLSDVAVWSGTTLLGATGAGGSLTTGLPNGTYDLTAVPGGAASDVYAPVTFQVGVNGAVADRVVELFPATATLTGTIRSASTGAPIVGATVTLRGATTDGAVLARSVASGTDGVYAIPLYVGNYVLTVSAPAFHAALENLTLAGGATSAGVSLTPATTAAASTPTGMSVPIVLVVAGIALVALAIGLVAWGTLRRRAP